MRRFITEFPDGYGRNLDALADATRMYIGFFKYLGLLNRRTMTKIIREALIHAYHEGVEAGIDTREVRDLAIDSERMQKAFARVKEALERRRLMAKLAGALMPFKQRQLKMYQKWAAGELR